MDDNHVKLNIEIEPEYAAYKRTKKKKKIAS